jgi:hypothetical protein
VTFKAYDILSSLILGFLLLCVLMVVADYKYDKDLIFVYTAVAFLVGYFMNAISSWMEPFYFWTWGGKPSDRLLSGHSIWKVKFYDSKRAKELLKKESHNERPLNDELFGIAMRNVHGTKDTRVADFNAMYAFSRILLTTILASTILLLIQNYKDWRYYAVALPVLLVCWLRSKQQGYYFAKEVLNEYLKSKTIDKSDKS